MVGGLTANGAAVVEILSGSQGSGPVVVTGAGAVLIVGSSLSGSQRLTGSALVQIADNPMLGGGITCSGNGQLVFSNNTVSGPNQCAGTPIFQQTASDCATAGGPSPLGTGPPDFRPLPFIPASGTP